MTEIPRDKGSYVLFLEVRMRIKLHIGGLGEHEFRPGIYAYVGSALGPGGLRARVLRHLSKIKKVRWHIDYLTTRPETRIFCILYIVSRKKIECDLARIIHEYGGRVVVQKFGSTDCRCPSHLFYIAPIRDLVIINRIIEEIRKIYEEFGVTALCLES